MLFYESRRRWVCQCDG